MKIDSFYGYVEPRSITIVLMIGVIKVRGLSRKIDRASRFTR